MLTVRHVDVEGTQIAEFWRDKFFAPVQYFRRVALRYPTAVSERQSGTAATGAVRPCPGVRVAPPSAAMGCTVRRSRAGVSAVVIGLALITYVLNLNHKIAMGVDSLGGLGTCQRS